MYFKWYQMVKDLIIGFEEFRKSFFEEDKRLYEKLVREGQKPKTMVIACSDSRVDPMILFGSKPGDLFVIRNVANLVPSYRPDKSNDSTSAALEFAVLKLQVEHIIVLGHSFCGGIRAACSHLLGEQKIESEFITSWVEIASPAAESVANSNPQNGITRLVEQASIINSIKNLLTFPWIRSAVSDKKLRVHGWWFDMEEGTLWVNKDGKKDFQKLSPV